MEQKSVTFALSDEHYEILSGVEVTSVEIFFTTADGRLVMPVVGRQDRLALAQAQAVLQ